MIDEKVEFGFAQVQPQTGFRWGFNYVGYYTTENHNLPVGSTITLTDPTQWLHGKTVASGSNSNLIVVFYPGFGDGPVITSYSYVLKNVSAFARSASVSRGLSRDTGEFQAGTASVTFTNTSQTFDPTYGSSPYYGEVKPQAFIRLTSAGYVIFTGFIDAWDFSYQVAGDATVTVNATDATSRLSIVEFPADYTFPVAQSPFDRLTYCLSDSVAKWKGGVSLDGGQFTIAPLAVSAGDSVWSYMQKVAQSDGGTLFVSADNRIVFRSSLSSTSPTTFTTYRYNLCSVPSFESATITGWSGTRSNTVAYKGSWSLQSTGGVQSWASNSPVFFTQAVQFSRAATWTENTPYTFSVWVRSATQQYVTLRAGFKTGSTINAVSLYQNIQANTWTRLYVTGTPSVAGMTAYLSVDGGSTFYVDAVLIEAGNALYEYFDGTYGPADTGSVDYTPSWDGTAELSTSKLTIVTTYAGNQSNSVYLSDGTENLALPTVPYTDIQVVYAGEQMVNQVVVLRSTNTGSTATNTDNGIAYGLRTYSFTDSLLYTDADADALARYYLGMWDEPEYRANSVTVSLHGLNPFNGQIEAALKSDLWDTANVTFTPNGGGSTVQAFQRVYGIQHEITPDTHNVTFELGTMGRRFRLDSTILGVLDQNVLGY